jgi:hypothetical protein
MSTTLARKLRRVSLQTTTQLAPGTGETIRVPLVRNSVELEQAKSAIIQAWRARRKANRRRGK